MGNRMLKESIRMSEQIEQLDWFEEVMFYRLIVTVDDYGIYSANPVVLSRTLFPMKEDVTSGMIKDALMKYVELGLIDVYVVENKGVFLKLATWENHQRLHESKHKFPVPDDGQIINGDIICGDFPKFSASSGNVQKKSEKNRLKPSRNQVEVEENSSYCSEVSENPSEPPVIFIPLNDGTEFGVMNEDVEKYHKLYPAVDVMQELRSMVGWCDANPTRKKTKSGVKKFINSWLSKAQNNGGVGYGGSFQKMKGNSNPYADMVMGEE